MNRTFDCLLSVKNFDEEGKGSFSGYASVFDVADAQAEAVAHGAFKVSLENWKQMGKLPKLLWQHDSRKPIGFWHEIREDPYGLYVKGKLLLDLRQGREAYSLLKNGVIDGLSIGFITVRARKIAARGTTRLPGKNFPLPIRILEEVNLQEISLVTFAANPKAQVDHIKMDDAELDHLLKRLDDLGTLLKGQRFQPDIIEGEKDKQFNEEGARTCQTR